ncbi:LysR family transcriptional regulator [Demequina capsici]|uniref:LysR family transcriptional regulator n=1 Tax=Demequina capsici TaxID=3075620 RepID=A0AA96FCF6_9MICO|nr:LysR family transcriptional regulator [Demequina sp. OYTSA14]WNM25760.1 LysR family transcriptional regulator [Demequina sp. OYTSA14]
MEIRHLELLRELRDRGTLSAVAEATYRTPSALSQQLRTAERELGVRLVEPASRGLRLTWAGQLLADGADDVLASVARLQATLEQRVGEPQGVVRIGSLPSAGAALLPGVMAALDGTLIHVELEDFDLAESDFASRTADADLVIAHSLSADVPRGAERLISRVVAREPIDVAVPAGHRLGGHVTVSPADVGEEPWIAVPRGYPFATVHEAIESATGVALRRLAEVRDNRLVEALVARGLGVALLPRFSTPESVDYRLIPLSGVHAVRSIVVIARPDRVERQAVRAVLDLLTAEGDRLSR